MISGYEVGTEVKWNTANTLTFGSIIEVIRETKSLYVNGQFLNVKVSDNSPTYIIVKSSGELVVLDHREVMLKSTNPHT